MTVRGGAWGCGVDKDETNSPHDMGGARPDYIGSVPALPDFIFESGMKYI